MAVVTGRYDLILQVLLNQDFGLLQFYTDEVSRISEVQSVETFVVYKGYNTRVPYVL
ncbi:MAG: Lrp/AsnC ligand binding domain-containing protein [Desulfobacteraceae bacterium]